MEEVKLPEPKEVSVSGYNVTVRAFTADQMLAYGAECARVERERRVDAALWFVGAAGPFGDPEIVGSAASAVQQVAHSLAVSLGLGHGLTQGQAEEMAPQAVRAAGVAGIFNDQSKEN